MTRHEMRVLNAQGDQELVWEGESGPDVEKARKAFADFQKQGYAAFVIAEEGAEPVQTHRFEPEATTIILVPQIVGG